ncbi:MAG: zinc ABC transporter substrate-binding protein [Candidatus Heimdallarchaeota archaeon]|nr:zinc ABC transporter substrate-binding protein [Candidatus Heimdallarchaeota archaeon]
MATMNFLGDFAEGLLGEHGEVQSIVSGSIDPHFFEPSANDLINLQEADVILAIGHEEIDQWLTDFIEDNPDLRSKVFNVIDLEATLEYDSIIDSKNPHFWLSPINALTMVENIKNHFVELQLVENEIIDANYLNYKNQLQTLLTEIDTQASVFNGTKVVVDHPALFYFLNLLGFERMGAIEEREGVDPSPLHIQELRNLIKAENVELIIASKTQAGSDVHQLAADTGIKIAFLTALPGVEGAESYTELISYNLNSLNNPQEPKTQDGLPIDFRVFSITVLTLIIIRKKAQKTN